MHRSRWAIALVAVVVWGCEKKGAGHPPVKTGSELPAGPEASRPPPTPAPAPGPFLPASIADGRGIALADAQGGTIAATADDGSKIEIADGAAVAIAEIAEMGMGAGGPDSATVDVVVGGKRVALPAGQVLHEEALQRSPDGAVAVFSFINSCGDLCHTMLYVVASDGRRAKLGDGVVDVVVAWRADGKELAVGSGSLWLVALPELQVRAVHEYTAPAYAPDGTLYVRDQDGSAYTLTGTEATRVHKAKKQPPLEEGDYGADDPPPVTFDADGRPRFPS